jgi:hypothetical protein
LARLQKASRVMNPLTAKSERPYHCRASSLASATDEPEEACPSECKGIGSGRSGLILVSWRMAMWIMSSLPREAVDRSDMTYYAADIHKDGDPKKSVTVYVRALRGQAEVVGVERSW